MLPRHRGPDSEEYRASASPTIRPDRFAGRRFNPRVFFASWDRDVECVARRRDKKDSEARSFRYSVHGSCSQDKHERASGARLIAVSLLGSPVCFYSVKETFLFQFVQHRFVNELIDVDLLVRFGLPLGLTSCNVLRMPSRFTRGENENLPAISS